MTISIVEKPNYATQSVGRALDMLELVASKPTTLREAAAELSLNRSTAYKTLAALEARGYVWRDPESTAYFLGAKILKLADCYRERNPLIAIARPCLEALVRETQETAHLCMREGLVAVCVDRIDSPQSIKLSVRIGGTTPLPVTAAAKAILAYCPEETVRALLSGPLPKLTENTITDPERLHQDLVEIRARGFACSEGELTPGARSVAAPVWDGSNQVIASVGISGPDTRLPGEILSRYAKRVMEVAGEISARLAPI